MGANNNIHLLEEEKALGDHYDHHDDHNNSYGQNEEEDHSSDSNWADEDDDDDADDHDHESNNSNEFDQERALYWESQESLLQEIVEHHRSTGGKLRKEINGLIEKARETNICKCVNPKSDGWCSRCLRQRVVTMLCCRGLHATLCTSKWTHTPKFPGGTHEYIEVTASTQSRKKQVIFLIELEFRDEFKMGKACDEYHHLIKQLPEIYIGKAEHLNAIVRVVCDAAKRSTMEKKIHMGPWRKTSFMQKKWSASSSSSSSSPSRQAHIPSGEVKGVLYAAEWSGPRLGTMGIWDYDSKFEISLNLRREDCSRKSDCGEQGDYALIAEWMFLRALKWHSDGMEVGGFIAAEDNMQDLFPLRIRLSVSWETNLLVVKISQKDNKISAFHRACDIFCVESGLLSIWDFSGQTTQIFTHDRIKLPDVSDQPDEEIHLELQVYGSSFFMKMGGGRKDEMTVEQSIVGGSLRGGSLQMNGNTDHVNSYIRVNRSSPFGSSYKEACNLGLTGLYNLGNTCFMNSAIQCLVHTPKLVDYFLGDYRKDINTENPLGMNGELALLFGDLLRKLWAPGATPVAPRAFKSKLSAFAPQFSGYNQHDSQEFLAFLLDGLHEDLNRVKYKPYIEAKEAEDRPDEEVADGHWRNHLARNDSIIVDVCQGQYRSKLVCPACKKLSVTFDPFMYLSLPLPSTTMRSMTLTVMSTDGSTLPFPVTVTVPKYGRCKDLVQALSTTCSLRDDEKLLVAEIFNNRILHFLDKPSDSIELIRDNDLLVAYRLPKDSETSSLVVFMHEQVERHFLHATSSSKRFGIPLVARISDLSRGSEIRREFLKLLNSFLMPVEDCLNEDDNDQNSANEDIDMEDVISSRLSDRDVNSDSGSGDDSHLGPDDFQFYLMEERGGLLSKVQKMQMNEIVTISELTRTINVLVSWPDKMTKLYDTCLLSSLPQICKPGLLTKEPQESVSLYKCLEAFLKEEPLGPEDMWYCPNCKKHRQASKKLDLWRLPEILIIHLKRFSYNQFFKNKLETFVDFPIDDFDLSTYIVHQSAQVSHRYVLYAVSNHYGGMGGGHYTAFVQLGRDRWYEFDDSLVSPASEEQIKTSAAYVLFYRRIPDV